MKAGAAAVDITPPVGTALDGYSGRKDVSLGIHDPLYARALVLEEGDQRVALVVCDLIGIGRGLAQRARELIAGRPGIPPSHVMVSATHTHAGPAGVRGAGEPVMVETVARLIAGAVQVAAREAEEAVLKYGVTHLESIAQNRRHPDWPIDTRLEVLAADTPEGENVATAIRYSCHATTLERDNLEITAEYPGEACFVAEQILGPRSTALFFNGCCGNINPTWVRQDYPEVHRVGSIVGARAAALSQELRPLGQGLRAHNIRWNEITERPVIAGHLVEPAPFSVASVSVDMPYRRGPADAEMESLVRDLEAGGAGAAGLEGRRQTAARLSRARTERLALQRIAGEGPTRPEEVQAFRLGRDLYLLALPGEVFVETQEEIRRRCGLDSLIVVAYANDYPGYFCRPEAYEQGGYEAGVTPFAPEAEPLLVAGALAALEKVR